MIGKCLITTGDKVIGTVIIAHGLYSQLKEMPKFSLQLEKIEMSFFSQQNSQTPPGLRGRVRTPD